MSSLAVTGSFSENHGPSGGKSVVVRSGVVLDLWKFGLLLCMDPLNTIQAEFTEY